MVTKAQESQVTSKLDETEASSFESVATAEMAVMYRVARRLAPDAVEAEDLVGQALLLAARGWPAFYGRHPRSWLLKILKNEAQKRSLDKKTHFRLFEDQSELTDSETERRIGEHLTAEAIVKAMDRIPWEYRVAVTLCDGEGMTYEEAADVLDVPLGTIRSRLYRGRRLLQQKLQRWSD